jgi:hypothetical protein
MTIPTTPTEPHPIDDQPQPEFQTTPISPDAVTADQSVSKGGLLAWIRSHKKISGGIAAGVATLATTAVIAGNTMRGPSDGAPAPTGTPISETTAPPSETPTASPSEIQAPVLEKYPFNVDKATVDKYLGESQPDFLSLPIEQRGLVTMYYAENMPQFAADWYAISQNPLDKLPPAITVNMTNQQIVAFTVYLHRMAVTIPDPTDSNGYKMDVNAADKMIAGSYIDAATSQHYAGYIETADQFAHAGHHVADASTLAVSGVYFPMSVVNPNGSSEETGPVRTIKTLESDGTTVTLTSRWVVLANGIGTWIDQD